MDSPIFIGMPVYNGWELVEESLRSIRDQSFGNYRVLISVDAADQQSADVCRKYTEDPRVQMFVQPERLGWAANLNWLMSRCDCEFFCYWQQDDICAISYLEALCAHAIRHPEAACTYTDVQWFGGRIDRNSLPSVTGTPFRRVLTQIEKGHFAPFRGLIRASAIAAAGPIRVTQYDSRLEDLVWVAKIAREGELHRIDESLYFKRVHRDNTHSTARPLDKKFRRAVWIEYGLGMLEVAWPLVQRSGGLRLVNLILERLLLDRDGRWLFYDPAEDGPAGMVEFANEFLNAAIDRFGTEQLAGVSRLPNALAVLEVMAARPPDARECASEASLISVALHDEHVRRLRDAAARSGVLEERFGRGESGTALLDRGWAVPEDWGVWSLGLSARLALPIPQDGAPWRVTLRGHAFVDGPVARVVRVILRANGEPAGNYEYSAASPAITISFVVVADGSGPAALDIELPDAMSPAQLGLSSDLRVLSLALMSISIQREVDNSPLAAATLETRTEGE